MLCCMLVVAACWKTLSRLLNALPWSLDFEPKWLDGGCEVRRCLQFHIPLRVRYFRNPCDRDPPTRNFKNFKFFKNSLKILNVYFWGTSVYFGGTSVYFWGTGVYFWGTSVYFWG